MYIYVYICIYMYIYIYIYCIYCGTAKHVSVDCTTNIYI